MPFQLATVRDPQSAELIKGLALREKQRDRALTLWRRARRFDPENPTLAGHEALVLLDAGRPRDVVGALAPLLPAHPRNIHLCNLLGVALYELGHAREALRLFEHCLSLDADYPPAAASCRNARTALSRAKPAPADVRAVVDRVIEEAPRRPRPTLAVCMIVKDEAEFLTGALESVRGVADEIIVVDTGSTDDTVALALAAGARVEHFPWTGDFSAARNASIDHASADWVLVLDADERLNVGSRSTLRAVLEEEGGAHRVVCPRIHNYTRERRYLNDGFSGRLFRNVPEMRFSGRVHEEVGVDVPDSHVDYRLDVILDHYGADPEVMREKAKDERNIELLEARLAEKPDDLLTWFYLGSQHWVAPRVDLALEAFQRVVELFERNPTGFGAAIRHVPVPYSYVGLVRALIHNGRAEEAADAGERGLAVYPENPDLWYHTAFAWIDRGDLSTARRFVQRSMEVELRGYGLISMHDPAIRTWRAPSMLADLDYEAGDHAAAYAGYRAAWPEIPEHVAERVTVAARLVELSTELGDTDAVVELTLSYLALRPGETGVALQVAAWLQSKAGAQAAYDLLTTLYAQVEGVRDRIDVPLAIAQIAEQAGEDAEALRWYEQVVAQEPRDPAFWGHLAQLFLRLGDEAAAAEAVAFARNLIGPDG